MVAVKTTVQWDSAVYAVRGWTGMHDVRRNAPIWCAVNQQKDIVFDGTMTWSPFVEQTIAMVRDHENSYRRGPGYVVDEHDNVVER